MSETNRNLLGEALALLFVAFPTGVTDAVKTLYYGELARQGFEPETVTEAAQRILYSREQRTVPPLAIILRECRIVRSEQSQQADEESEASYAEARDLAERRLRYFNGIPNLWRRIPITQANIDLHIRQMEREEMIRVVD